jgi:hypothetical protein
MVLSEVILNSAQKNNRIRTSAVQEARVAILVIGRMFPASVCKIRTFHLHQLFLAIRVNQRLFGKDQYTKAGGMIVYPLTDGALGAGANYFVEVVSPLDTAGAVIFTT